MVKDEQSPLIPLMALRGYKQKDIAEHLGFTEKTVSNWMTGKTETRLTLAEWKKLAAFLGCALEDLPDSFAPQAIHRTVE
jgi:DNA-binding Xre family transcriptional regulator